MHNSKKYKFLVPFDRWGNGGSGKEKWSEFPKSTARTGFEPVQIDPLQSSLLTYFYFAYKGVLKKKKNQTGFGGALTL